MLTPPKTNSGDTDAWLVLPRAHRVVLVVDVVESVRLMEQDEEDTITRWRAFVRSVERELLAQHGGRLVKSLGDGLMLEFERVLPAVQTALAMQQLAQTMNQGREAERCMFLRMGVHAADVVVDERDIYGAGVNLAARLATLAGPGEVVVSAEVRDELVDGVDATLEDMGECHLKHVNRTLRAFRIPHGGEPLPKVPSPPNASMAPQIAVLPFKAVGAAQSLATIADILSEDISAGLSRAPQLRVVSRLSTAGLRNRDVPLPELARLLRAHYVVSGTLNEIGGSLRLALELSDLRTGVVLWAGRAAVSTPMALRGEDPAVPEAIASVTGSILSNELDLARATPLRTMDSHTLLSCAVSLMHRAQVGEFEQARAMLEHLSERHPRLASPHTWLAKWYGIRAAQGWSHDLREDAGRAMDCIYRALRLDEGDSLAWTIKGLVEAYISKDFPAAESSYERALGLNRSEPLAWLYSAVLKAWQDNGEEAVAAAERAQSLSPLDPMGYYFDSLASTAFLVAGRLDEAIATARQSLRRNRLHASTSRTLAIALVLDGQEALAREVVKGLLEIEPGLTVSRFRQRYPGARSAHVGRFCDALSTAGVPP